MFESELLLEFGVIESDIIGFGVGNNPISQQLADLQFCFDFCYWQLNVDKQCK